MEKSIGITDSNKGGAVQMLRKEALPTYIRTAFAAEFYAWPDKRDGEIVQEYEKRVKLMMGAVANHLRLNKEERKDPHKVKDTLATADEPDLYGFLKSVLYDGFKGSYARDTKLSSLILENKFNCFTASFLVWDAMRRMGKEMQGVLTNSHFFLTGENYAFDVVSDYYAFPKYDIPIVYKKHEIISNMAEEMGGAVCIQYALLLRGSGMPESQKVVSLSKAGMLNAPEMYASKGHLLIALVLAENGNTDEAREICREMLHRDRTRANALNIFYVTCRDRNHYREYIERVDRFTEEGGNDKRILIRKGIAQARLGDRKNALETCRKVLMSHPKDPYVLLWAAAIISENSKLGNKNPKKAQTGNKKGNSGR